MSAENVEQATQDNQYEMFRWAIMERDEEAWRLIYECYHSLMVSWARHSSTASQIGEYYNDIADQAFARAWAGLSPHDFAQFSSLAKLLAYLRACVTAVVIDYARARMARDRMFLRLETSTFATPEEQVLDELERAELWELVQSLAETEQERTILVENFVYDLPPRVILARHPELFGHNISMVYFAKRNLMARLNRNRALQQMRRDFYSA